MKQITQEFEKNYFVNVDNGVLVNLNYIKRINYNNIKITLIHGYELYKSLRKVKEVKEVKNKYHVLLAGS